MNVFVQIDVSETLIFEKKLLNIQKTFFFLQAYM